MPRQQAATLIGLVAVLLWSSIVGLIRSVSQALGATGGAAMIYSLASLLLLATVGLPSLRAMPRPYLAWGSGLFVAYELCLALSIGYAGSGRQAIEVGMVNYLWPTFTLLAAIAFNGQRASWLVLPGLLVALAGVAVVLGGEQGLELAGMAANIRGNPLSYGLALAGAIIWAAYCSVTARMAKGANAITLFFMLVALALWIKYLAFDDGRSMQWSWRAALDLALAAGAMGLGYAAWNVGILHGHVNILAGASYFTPVFSAALAALLLGVPLPASFWAGAFMVCGGAILCWGATCSRRAG